jgi:hypothetical protein
MERLKTEERRDIFVSVIIGIVFIGLIFGFSSDKVINWIIPLGISFILTGIAGDLLESITGDFFKKIHLSFSILGFRLNIPLFIILTFLIKIWLFK